MSVPVIAILLGLVAMLWGIWRLRTHEPDSHAGLDEFLCGVVLVLGGCVVSNSFGAHTPISLLASGDGWKEVVQVVRIGILLVAAGLCTASIVGIFSRDKKRTRGTVSRALDGLED